MIVSKITFNIVTQMTQYNEGQHNNTQHINNQHNDNEAEHYSSKGGTISNLSYAELRNLASILIVIKLSVSAPTKSVLLLLTSP